MKLYVWYMGFGTPVAFLGDNPTHSALGCSESVWMIPNLVRPYGTSEYGV